MRTVLARLALTIGLAFGAAQANAVTLSDIVVGDQIGSAATLPFNASVSGSTASLTGFGATPASFTFDGVSYATGILLGTALQDSVGALLIRDGLFPFSNTLLTGTVVDTDIDLVTGIARALFSNDSGTSSGALSNYILVTIDSSATIVDGSNSGSMSMFEVSTPPVPLPAGGGLLITGLGVLILARWRKHC